jgi:hypothetical protein
MKRYKSVLKENTSLDNDTLEGKEVKTLIDKIIEQPFRKNTLTNVKIKKGTKGIVTFVDRIAHKANVKFNLPELKGVSIEYGLNNIKAI